MGENALTGFHHSQTVDGWVQCTQLQIMDAFLRKSFQEGDFQLFGDLTKYQKNEIASNIRDEIHRKPTKNYFKTRN
jgi:hypothetical protein